MEESVNVFSKNSPGQQRLPMSRSALAGDSDMKPLNSNQLQKDDEKETKNNE